MKKKGKELKHKEKKEEQTKKVKKIFKDEGKLSEELEKLKAENVELKDALLRKVAEFENYKRRTDNEQANLLKYTGEHIITSLLPVIDDFERSLKHIKDAKDVNTVYDGLKIVFDKLMKTLNEQGISKIVAVGKQFDVEFHEAIMQKREEGVKPHTVLDEIETGYIYKDRVIRHSKVIVSEDLTEETVAENNVSETKNEEKEN
ncbi:MAG: nucleotide exchange factor GrpE [Bacteroidetes bacterium]|nr:nucleotide exchange factor GrpE [Bacteroidota bacterium]MCH8942485.1 nucleotide exchange factor GrpE [Bacteroidota bacterium]